MKLLALAEGNRLHREQAMDTLWRDRGPAAAANNLNQAVHVARRALAPEAIEVRGEPLATSRETQTPWTCRTVPRSTSGWSPLKDEYDPTNVFRLNQNVKPSTRV